jgi:putative peptidoglycan lipid II flippase
VGLIVLAVPMLVTLFRYGEFSDHDVTMSSYSLMAFSTGLTAFILVKVLASGFYARQDIRTPVRIAVMAMFLNLLLNLALVFPLAHAGLALATSLAAVFNAALLFRALHRSGAYQPRPGWTLLLLRVGFACAVMAAVLWFGVGDAHEWSQWRAHTRVWHLLLWTCAGTLVYLVGLFATGLRLKDLHSEHA